MFDMKTSTQMRACQTKSQILKEKTLLEHQSLSIRQIKLCVQTGLLNSMYDKTTEAYYSC